MQNGNKEPACNRLNVFYGEITEKQSVVLRVVMSFFIQGNPVTLILNVCDFLIPYSQHFNPI